MHCYSFVLLCHRSCYQSTNTMIVHMAMGDEHENFCCIIPFLTHLISVPLFFFFKTKFHVNEILERGESESNIRRHLFLLRHFSQRRENRWRTCSQRLWPILNRKTVGRWNEFTAQRLCSVTVDFQRKRLEIAKQFDSANQWQLKLCLLVVLSIKKGAFLQSSRNLNGVESLQNPAAFTSPTIIFRGETTLAISFNRRGNV